MSEKWRPLNVRTGQRTGYDALEPGVPAWLANSLMEWATSYFTWVFQGSIRFNEEALKEIERRLKLPRPFNASTSHATLQSLQAEMLSDPEVFLNVVDWILHQQEDDTYGQERVAALVRCLAEAGSVWTAVWNEGHAHLEERVDLSVREAADRVMTEGGRPGEHLRLAWAAVYGRHPDPGGGYRQAVSAVEAAACLLISPHDAICTLGKVIGQIRAQPTRLSLKIAAPAGVDRAQVLLGMLDLLWKGQSDRHGKSDPAAPLTVSKPEAEAAVHLAVTLVHWFTSGAVVWV